MTTSPSPAKFAMSLFQQPSPEPDQARPAPGPAPVPAPVSEAPAPPASPPARVAAYSHQGMAPLRALWEECDALKETLADVECISGDAAGRKIRRMAGEVDAFAPAITFIGQIKSGKTTLVNAMAGRPGFLPADVNPWTSVVTSLNLNVPRRPGDPAARFRLFDADEWDHLVHHGGRIGELSARTGADREHEKLRRQVAEMREKTRARIGAKFELLLGQVHDYNEIRDDLIERYVCMGDDPGISTGADRGGQFADLTKSAELFLDAPGLPIALTLRDTPGMNDTFMMREQITIRAIRDSRICVVVLSAHQALNSVDMGLIRLITNVQSRQVVIFINRTDELRDPAREVPEIRDSLLKTLADQNGPTDPCIIFGSALWANSALEGNVDDLPEATLDSLEAFAAAFPAQGVAPDDIDATLWQLSGLPALWSALGERIVESDGAEMLTRVRRRAANMVEGLRASSSLVTLRANGDALRRMSPDEIMALLNTIETEANMRLDEALEGVLDAFSARVDQAHTRFLARALDSLLEHLERHGDKELWNYSPDGLRMLIRSAYQVLRTRYRRDVQTELDATATCLTRAYGSIFAVSSENFAVAPPAAPDLPPPVSLAQTIVLDVKTSWWKSWWGSRKGYRAFASGFRDLIEAETTPMVDSLKVEQANELRAMAQATLRDFLQEQRSVLDDICRKADVELEDLHGLFGVASQDEREDLFDMLLDALSDGEELDVAKGDAA